MNAGKNLSDLDEVIAALKQHRDGLSREIESVEKFRNQPPDRDVQLVLRYIVEGTASKAAAWAHAQGWRVATDTPKGRKYTYMDINELVTSPPDGWTKELVALAWRSYWTDARKRDRGETM